MSPTGTATAARRLLDRLEHVKEIGSERWISRCPGHDDRTPSLSLRELEDGRILLHCFAGCAASDVVAAVGLKLSDLFPERTVHCVSGIRPTHYHAAREALKVQAREALIVAIAAENVVHGLSLTEQDRVRLLTAAGRIRAAADIVR